jgi:hypothetical protein
MANIPAIRKKSVPYRTRSHSEDQNDFSEDIFFDIMQAFSGLNAQRQEITELTDVFTLENKFLQLRLLTMQNQLAALEQLQAEDGSFRSESFVADFQPTAEAPGVSQVGIDELYQMATLPLAGGKVSKLYLLDHLTGIPFVPASTLVEVSPADNGASVRDKNLRSAVDGLDTTTWLRRVSTPVESGIYEATAEILITLPDDIISNRSCNVITLQPFPAQSVDIVNVEYGLDGYFLQVPGFVAEQGAGPTKLCFPARPMSQVRVTLRQRHWVEEFGQKVFHLGARDIGVCTETYSAGRAEFLVPVTLSGAGPYRIESVTPIVTNSAALAADSGSLFSYSLYSVDGEGALVYTQDQLPLTVDDPEIVLRATLHVDAQTGSTPALSAVRVRYTI